MVKVENQIAGRIPTVTCLEGILQTDTVWYATGEGRAEGRAIRLTRRE